MGSKQIGRSVLALVFFGIASSLAAQNAVVLFVDDPFGVSVTPRVQRRTGVDIGDSIPAGSTIETDGASIELQLRPSGAIVFLAPGTQFSLDEIVAEEEVVEHRFSLARGKMRMVVSEFFDDIYEVETPAAVLGVRGTDFAQRVIPGETDWVCVLQGEVSFTRRRDNRTIRVENGTFADALETRFAALEISGERLEEVFSDVQFMSPEPDAIRDLRQRVPSE